MNTFESLESRVLLAADMVIDWNNITIDVLRADTTLPGPTWASRSLAMVHAAIYDAVNGIDRSFEPYKVHVPAPPGASMDAAIASAAHRVLSDIYPLQRAFLSQALQDSLAEVPNGSAKAKGVAYGRTVGTLILVSRLHDGAGDKVDYTVNPEAGHWEPDPLNPGQTALGPEWGSVKPFSMLEGPQFRPPHPPALSSADYTAAFNEVKALGGDGTITPTTRTPEQTEIGIFWGYDRAGLGAPPSLYNQITQVIADQENNSVVDNARLFLLVNIAQVDAGIGSWDCKYVDDFWRPVTAIRRAAEDGNPDTTADTTWTPLGAPGNGTTIPNFTPPFPAYVSGHATFGAATFRVLEHFYGSDQMNFTIGSDELPGVTRSYTSFSQASAENARSRIYLGIHWNFDDSFGQELGRDIADWVVEKVAQPVENNAAQPIKSGQIGEIDGVFSQQPIAQTSRLIDDINEENTNELV